MTAVPLVLAVRRDAAKEVGHPERRRAVLRVETASGPGTTGRLRGRPMIRRLFRGSQPQTTSTKSTPTDHASDAGPRAAADARVSRRELRQLKWLTALVPGTVVLIYEFARQEALEHILPALPVQYGNVAVWVLVLLLTYAFATFVFSIVERLQAQAIARSRELATLSAVLEERARLSRELHDGFAQLVAFLLVRIDTVEGLLASSRSAEAMVELERMRSVTDDLYQDVRESISELRTRVSERGLPATVREYVDAYEDRHDLTVHLAGENIAAGLPALIAFQLLRIIQEALANVQKHAHAHNAWISFARPVTDILEMIVADDGQGFEPDATPVDASRRSFGLASMRERVESLGGQLNLDSRPGGGTRVIVSIPFKSGAVKSGALAPAAR
jgi:two-component system sensor histidine kinase DegS